MTDIQKLCNEYKEEIIEFLKKIISIKSLTGDEKAIAEIVKAKMQELGYDEILESELGDVIGVIGNGPKKIIFDSHMDVVEVNDESDWKYPPFAAHTDEEYIHGRGTVDMKSAIASSVYAGYFAKKLGYTEGKTVYVSASVMEEDFDGYALGKLIDEFKLDLDYAVICEPSEEKIALGHRGRAMFEIHTHGISCHGSAPENGKNAVYEMRKVIERVEALNERLYQINGEHGSVVLSKIECETVSLNAVPAGCTIYLDRRLAMGETYEIIEKEMDELIEGLDADWNVYIAKGKSYTDKQVDMYTFMKAWETQKDAPLPTALASAYREQTDREPEFFKWNFSTNGFATTDRNIATIGLGPGEMKYAHMRDEKCKIREIMDCCMVYTGCIENI